MRHENDHLNYKFYRLLAREETDHMTGTVQGQTCNHQVDRCGVWFELVDDEGSECVYG